MPRVKVVGLNSTCGPTRTKRSCATFSTVRAEPMSWSKVSFTVRLYPTPSYRRLFGRIIIRVGGISEPFAQR
jgi:hypothetical protein